MARFRSTRLLSVAAAMALSACSGPGSSMPTMAPGADATPRSGLAGLVNNSGVITAEEAELRDIQRRPTAIAFPASVGVLFYDYSDPLRPEDQQAAVEQLGKEMVETGLVSAALQIPPATVRPGDNLDALRKLAARFQVDVLLIVSGSSSLDKAGEQPGGFLGFGDPIALYEARASLSGLAIGVFSGTFLTPFSAVGVSPQQAVEGRGTAANEATYQLRLTAQKDALGRLKTNFIDGLRATKATQDAATPAPSAAPTLSPVATPTPTESATPTPAASV